MLRGFLKSLARFNGYVALRKSRHPSLEAHQENLLQQFNIDLVLDVGANKGQFGQALRKFGYKGQIISFEPNPDAYQELVAKTQRDAQWTAHNIALGAEDGKADLIFAKNSLLSSFHPPSSYSKDCFGEKIDTIKSEPVTVNTLDSFLAEQNITLKSHRVMLKLDTQGHDLEVWQGASNSLPFVTLLQSELSFKALYDGIPTYLEALMVYTDFGFEPTGLYPIGRNPDTAAIIEADCLFSRLPNE